jgi:hypothetical protein
VNVEITLWKYCPNVNGGKVHKSVEQHFAKESSSFEKATRAFLSKMRFKATQSCRS